MFEVDHESMISYYDLWRENWEK